MPARLWTIPDLPVGTPLPHRLVSLDGQIYLEAGSHVTERLKSALEAQGVAGFLEEPTAPADARRVAFLDPPTAAPAPVQKIAPAEQVRWLRTACPEQVFPEALETQARLFVRALYRRPMDPVDLRELELLVQALLKWAGSLAGPPVLPEQAPNSQNWLADHVLESALWCAWFATTLPLSAVEQKGLIAGALLRDIGELACPPEFLWNRGPLLARDKAALNDHPFKSIHWLARLAIDNEHVHKIVRQHHERFDGTGYPLRLPAEYLALSSQVLHLADTFSAVSSPRPHRGAKTLHQAIGAVIQGSGTQFDPVLTRLFIERVGQYPPGSIVRLEGRIPAVVLDSAGGRRWRPRVRVMVESAQGIAAGPEIDLLAEPVKIEQVLR